MTRYKVSRKNNNKYSMKFRELLIDKIEQLKIKNATLKFDYVVMLANALDIDLNKLKGV